MKKLALLATLAATCMSCSSYSDSRHVVVQTCSKEHYEMNPEGHQIKVITVTGEVTY